MKIDAITIKEQDNVATALREIQPEEDILVGIGEQSKQVQIKEMIPYGHKFAIRNILKGENIIKYGEIIGRATNNIDSGIHAHIQNIESLRGRGDLE